jgi:hypothetical protein
MVMLGASCLNEGNDFIRAVRLISQKLYLMSWRNDLDASTRDTCVFAQPIITIVRMKM